MLAAGTVIAVTTYRGRMSGPGGGTLVLFALLAALTALSVTWSVAPGLSYIEAGRTLTYLAVFAAGVAAARLAPRSPEVILIGVSIAAVAIASYALASRVWPATLAANEVSNRIGAPFQYWNAVGTTAALAVPCLLWLGSSRTSRLTGRALAYPGLGLCILAILLTQSRGALVAAALVALAWFVLVPLRLRSLPVLIAPAAAAGAVGAWALSKDAFSKTLQPFEARESVAGDFGLLLLMMIVLLLLAGLAVNAGLARWPAPMRWRRVVGVGAATIACLAPLVAFTSVAASDGRSIGDRVDQLVSETDTAPEQGAGRFTAASSTRGKYWREAGRVLGDRPSVGAGAGAFEVARLRHRTDGATTRHAHGYVVQTLADLGIVGLCLSLALFGGWLLAASRTTGLLPRHLPFRGRRGPFPRRDWDGERIAFVALTLSAIAFGLQSAIDWTWFVPGPTAMALLSAGYVAGRGPVAVLHAHESEPSARAPHPFPSSRPARVAAAAAVGLAAVLAAWAIWQPEASDRAVKTAIELSDEGRYEEAISKSNDAADADPLSPARLLARAQIEAAAGRDEDAAHTLERAALRFPGEPGTWLALARFQLLTLDRPREALGTLRGAFYLDPFSREAGALFLQSRAAARVAAAGAGTPRR